MRPGPRFLNLLAVPLAFALFTPWAPGAGWVAFLALAMLLGAGLYERQLLRQLTVHAERKAVVALPLDEEETVAIQFRTNSPRPVTLEVRQLFPRIIEPTSVSHLGLCLPGEILNMDFRVRGVERGTEQVAAAWVGATFWGLAERILPAGESGEVSVLPNLHAVKRLHEQLNRYILRGLGNRAAPRLGKGREFDRLREYCDNDDFRDIAWKASARRGKLIVREYRLDRSQDVLVCLDRGHRMAARTTTIAKIDHAVNGAVLISYLCNRMEDRVGMLAFGAAVDKGLSQGRGPKHMRQTTAFATGVKGEYIHTDYLALAAHIRHRLRHRSLILILTDLPEGDHRFALVKAIRMLIPQHLPLVLVLSDPALEAARKLLPADKEELCRTLVARDVWLERQQLIRDLRRHGAMVVETPPQDTGIAAINAYLEIKRRQLL